MDLSEDDQDEGPPPPTHDEDGDVEEGTALIADLDLRSSPPISPEYEEVDIDGDDDDGNDGASSCSSSSSASSPEEDETAPLVAVSVGPIPTSDRTRVAVTGATTGDPAVDSAHGGNYDDNGGGLLPRGDEVGPPPRSSPRSVLRTRAPSGAASSSEHGSSGGGRREVDVDVVDRLAVVKLGGGGDDDSATSSSTSRQSYHAKWCASGGRRARHIFSRTKRVMGIAARVLLWGSVVAMAAGVVWYSLELKNNGTDTHLIAWFSAGAFVILGFPIAIYGIFMHLTHYYQPNIQCYVVRILWMVPIYSIESWLCLRFHTLALYIETLRDCYEAYVLYSFLQFLINVLGGETELTLMLKDKSPTRGFHMRPLNWCVKPWLMGQPVMRQGGQVQWTSPFFVKCKFGVLQYVLLKYLTAIITMILEMQGMYKEGDFSPRGGYLYICIITNTSQCWALYCLAFFYYATKNELAPIRPIGKFLSVKALVFFTWWQSLGIFILYNYRMIPTYKQGVFDLSEEDVAKVIQDYLICIEMFCAAILHYFVFPHTDFSDNKDAALTARRAGLKQRHPRMGRHYKLSREQRRERMALLAAGSNDSGESSRLEEGGIGRNERGLASASGNPNSPVEGDDAGSAFVDDETATVQSLNSSASTADASSLGTESKRAHTGFVRAFIDSTVPRDVIDHSAGIVKGDYFVEKKTLLHHAATSDEYDLFQSSRGGFVPKNRVSSPQHRQQKSSVESITSGTSPRHHQRRRRQPTKSEVVVSSASTPAEKDDKRKNTWKDRLFAGLNSSANAVSIVPSTQK